MIKARIPKQLKAKEVAVAAQYVVFDPPSFFELMDLVTKIDRSARAKFFGSVMFNDKQYFWCYKSLYDNEEIEWVD